MDFHVTDDFIIEDLGEQDVWVYDIEVEDNHNFFGNDILVHNSVYVTIQPFMDTVKGKIQKRVDAADQFCKEVIQPFIDGQSQSICDHLNCYEQKMVWNREVIASEAFWVVKKKYAMNVWDSEGVRYKDKPKMKITGLEAKKSNIPEWSRDFLKECYKIVLSKNEKRIHQRLEEIEDEFYKLKPNEISIPSTVRGIDKYYDPDTLYIKGSPKHVKATINHNLLIEELGLKHLPKIDDGSKIKYLSLVKPNPYGYSEIAFDTYLPEEFGLDDYIDRKAVYERSFKSPIRMVLDAVGWTEEKIITL